MDNRLCKNYVYIINDEFELKYCNDALTGAYPELKCGDLCYEALMNEQEPCLQCPLKNSQYDEIPVCFRRINSWMNVKAGRIQMTGEESEYVLIASPSKELTEDTRIDLNAMTGLFYGKNLQKQVQDYVAQKENDCCFLVMDIEYFRFFNKWHGRAAGDRLLQSIARFLRYFDGKHGSLSGYCGGDNFCIVLEDDPDLIERLSQQVSDLVGDFEGITGFSTAIGGYRIRHSDETYRDMYDYATTAMKHMIGKYPKDVCWYGEELVSELEHEIRMLPEISRGIEDHEFEFYLQMKYSLSGKCVVGAEALLRWKHQKRGLIMPGEFIPLCEKNGMITRLDQYAWEEVCRTIRKWLDLGYEPIPISVNVSRRDFYEIDVPEYFQKLIEKYQIEPKYIEIEITESAFVENAVILRQAEEKFHKNGFTVLIDDFGSGYSSLNMLKDLKADILKMDVRFLDLNEKNMIKGTEIVKSVFDMASALQYTVIAEGVETEEQLNTLERIGCEYVQGFYFYEPMPVAQFEQSLLKLKLDS